MMKRGLVKSRYVGRRVNWHAFF